MPGYPGTTVLLFFRSHKCPWRDAGAALGNLMELPIKPASPHGQQEIAQLVGRIAFGKGHKSNIIVPPRRRDPQHVAANAIGGILV
jgi:hypothetical protein